MSDVPRIFASARSRRTTVALLVVAIGLFVLFLVFLIPGLPDDVICFVGGLPELRLRDVLVASILGRLPSYVVVNLAGDTVAASRYLETAVLVGIVSLAAFAVYRYRDEVTERLLSSGVQEDRR